MDRATLCTDLVKGISEKRMASYKKHTDRDDFNGVARYIWNIALCESLYPTIHCFEVALRNAVYDSLSTRHRDPNWIADENRFRNEEAKSVAEARGSVIDELSKKGLWQPGLTVEPERIVAKLGLGFWTGLFVRHYDQSIAIPAMNAGLKGFPRNMRTRENLYRRFDIVRALRNRVFHHEPIWYRDDLAQCHADIVEYIGCLNPTLRKVAELNDRFDAVYDSTKGWQTIGGRIIHELLGQGEGSEASHVANSR